MPGRKAKKRRKTVREGEKRGVEDCGESGLGDISLL
jgi:predicted RNA-binding protein with TRAM domain